MNCKDRAVTLSGPNDKRIFCEHSYVMLYGAVVDRHESG